MSVDEIVTELIEAGYRHKGDHIVVKGIKLGFDAVLQGRNEGNELLIVSSTFTREVKTAIRDARALLMLLERTGSMRPVTLVALIRDTEDRKSFDSLAAYCRIVVIEPSDEANAALHVLLPIPLPTPLRGGESAEVVLWRELGELKKKVA